MSEDTSAEGRLRADDFYVWDKTAQRFKAVPNPLDQAAEQIKALVLTWDYDAKPYQKAIDDVLAVLAGLRGDDG